MHISDEDNETVEYYAESWRAALRVLKGWSDEEIAVWVQAKRFTYSDHIEMMLHDAPMSYIAPLLVPDGARTRLTGPELVLLLERVQHVLEAGDSCRDFTDPGAFEGVAERLADAFREFE